MSTLKTCNKCGISKRLNEFYVRKNSKICSPCKECIRANQREYRKMHPIYIKAYQKKHREQILTQRKRYYQNNKEKVAAYNKKQYKKFIEKRLSYQKNYYWSNRERELALRKKYRKLNLERVRYQNKKWYKKNKKYAATKHKEWRKLNQKKIRAYHLQYKNNLYYINPAFKLSVCISKAIRHSIANKNHCHWENLVGYTIKQLKEHLENQFQPGMSWQNYGTWHIDHIIPISLWRFEKPEDREFQQCWALANLQPLWAKDNIRKGKRIYA